MPSGIEPKLPINVPYTSDANQLLWRFIMDYVQRTNVTVFTQFYPTLRTPTVVPLGFEGKYLGLHYWGYGTLEVPKTLQIQCPSFLGLFLQQRSRLFNRQRLYFVTFSVPIVNLQLESPLIASIQDPRLALVIAFDSSCYL